MAFCSKCGAQLNESERFCPNCGTAADGSSAMPNTSADSTGTLMGILSYLGILVLIPYFVKEQTPFVRSHAIRGINLFLLEVIAGAAVGLLGAVLPIIGGIVGWLVSLASLALSIIGIINVCNKEDKDLPVIGGIRLIKK